MAGVIGEPSPLQPSKLVIAAKPPSDAPADLGSGHIFTAGDEGIYWEKTHEITLKNGENGENTPEGLEKWRNQAEI